MTVEERVVPALRALADTLTPLPDPVGRAEVRLRRSRRRRITSTALALAVVVLAAGVFADTGKDERKTPTDTRSGWERVVAWSERLADSPTRGSIGSDRQYLDELQQQVARHQQAGDYELSRGRQYTQVQIVFAGDVGDRRVALVALTLAQHGPSNWAHNSGWLVAPKGADPVTLAAPASLLGFGDALEPMETGYIEDGAGHGIVVAIAAAGCVFSTAALPKADDWQPEPTGSYIVRFADQERPEWWRVTCEGVVRFEGPPDHRTALPKSQHDLDQARTTARGQADQVSLDEYGLAAASYGWEVTAPPAIVWAGQIAGAQPEQGRPWDGRAVVVAAPRVAGGWSGNISVTFDPAGTNLGTGVGFYSDTDPTDPKALVAVRLGSTSSSILLIAPTGAASVRALADGRVVATAPVRDGSGLVQVPDAVQAVYEALDANGRVMSHVKIADYPEHPTRGVSAWDQP